eukprot:2780809-Amphidinium_carterae.1
MDYATSNNERTGSVQSLGAPSGSHGASSRKVRQTDLPVGSEMAGDLAMFTPGRKHVMDGTIHKEPSSWILGTLTLVSAYPAS